MIAERIRNWSRAIVCAGILGMNPSMFAADTPLVPESGDIMPNSGA